MESTILSENRESMARDEFRLFAELTPHLAWIAQADGWIYWYNQRWYTYTGTTPKDMEGWGWQSVHHPVGLPGVLERWQASIRTGEPFEMTFPLLGADGVFRPFLTRVVPLRGEDGRVLRWFGTNTDISLEVATAAALRDSEQRFRIATEAVSGILWTNDPEGKMRGDQRGWSGFTGQTREEYEGYGWAQAVHPEDAQPTVDAWEAAVRESRLFSFEHRVRRHDGVYRLCSVRALPKRNDDGSVTEWIGVHTDITESRVTEERLQATVAALNREQEFVEAAQRTTRMGFWRYQPSTGKVYLSSGSRQLLGFSADEPVTVKEGASRLHPEDVEASRLALESAEVTGQYRLEFRPRVAAGEETRWVLGVGRGVSGMGEPDYLVGMHLDITEQKRSADALVRTEKLAVAGRLAATIAHEINNPLEAVTNLLYLLGQTRLDEEQRSYWETMGDEVRRVSEIATHTLKFHRQSAMAGSTAAERLMRSVLDLYEGRMKNAGVRAVCRFAEGCEVFGFDGELRQVLANLVGNAIDAMGNIDGERVLTVRTQSGFSWKMGYKGVVMTIGDTGTGMSRETLKKIFDPFFTTKGEVGTGLGLWVSSEIVAKHRGALSVRSSQGEGYHGTVFRLFLPSAAA